MKRAWTKHEPEWLNAKLSLNGWTKHEPWWLNAKLSLNGWTKHKPWWLNAKLSLNGWTKHEPWWLKTHCEEGIEAEVKGKAETTLGHCCCSVQSSHAETITFPFPLACRYMGLREHPLRPWSTNRFFCTFWPPPCLNNPPARTYRLHQA